MLGDSGKQLVSKRINCGENWQLEMGIHMHISSEFCWPPQPYLSTVAIYTLSAPHVHKPSMCSDKDRQVFSFS